MDDHAYKMRSNGCYPSEAETVYEATVLWVWDEDAGHPENNLRGFWRRENERSDSANGDPQ